MKARMRLRTQRGMTLAEMLFAVALLSTLLGVGFTAGGSMVRNARQASMDRLAKTLYLEASGRAAALGYAGSEGVARLGDEEHRNDEGRYGILSLNRDAGLLLPASVVLQDLQGGAWYISYTVENGACVVRELFCAGRLEALPQDAEERAEFRGRTAQARMTRSEGLGWYGEGWGDDAEEEPGEEPLSVTGVPKVGMKVDNALELTVTLCCELPPYVEAAPYYETIATPAYEPTFTLELSGNGKSTELTFTGGTWDSAARRFTKRVVLDSPAAGQHFRDVTEGAIDPGATLTLGVSAAYNGDAAELMDGDCAAAFGSSASVNSLFAERLEVEGEDYDLVKIANPRHLQNLNCASSGLSSGEALYAVLTENIVFPEDWLTKYEPFQNIINSGLVRLDGNGYMILDCEKNGGRSFIIHLNGVNLFVHG